MVILLKYARPPTSCDEILRRFLRQFLPFLGFVPAPIGFLVEFLHIFLRQTEEDFFVFARSFMGPTSADLHLKIAALVKHEV